MLQTAVLANYNMSTVTEKNGRGWNMLQDCDRKMIRQEDKELRSSLHETVDWGRPTQINMQAQDFIKSKRDWQRDRRCSTA